MIKNAYIVRLQYFESGFLEHSNYKVFNQEQNAINLFKEWVEDEKVNSWTKHYDKEDLEILETDNEFYIKRADDKLRTEISWFGLPVEDMIWKNDEFIQTIINELCDEFKVTEEQLLSDDRKRNYVYPRYALIDILVKNNISRKNVQKLVGKTHATIITAIENIPNMIVIDRDFKHRLQKAVNNIKTKLQSKDYSFNYKVT